MRSLVLGLWLSTVIGAAACSEDLGMPDGPGRYDSPSDFDRGVCQDDALEGLDPQAIYHYRIDYGDDLPRTAAARFDVLGDGLFGGVITGGDADRAWASDDDLFLHRVVGDPAENASRSLLFCDRSGDELRGSFAFCTPDQCVIGAATGQRVERLEEAAASGLTELSAFSGVGWDNGISVNVRVEGDLAYLARYQDGLRIVDITSPAAPVEVGHGPPQYGADGEIYNDVKLVTAGDKRYALLASQIQGVVVWDVTTPSAPVRTGQFGTEVLQRGTSIHTLFVDGGRAYLSHASLGLEIWDVADPAVPVRLAVWFPANTPDGLFLHDLYVEGPRAYLNFWNGGMIVADVSDPAAVREIGRFVGYGERTSHSSWVTTVGGRRIAAHGDEQWGSHLRLVDVSDGETGMLRQVGEWQTRPEVSAHNIMAFGSEVFLAHYQDGVRIVDISDPASPRTSAWFNTWPGYDRTYGYSFFEGAVGIDVDLARNRVYVADSNRGLVILSR